MLVILTVLLSPIEQAFARDKETSPHIVPGDADSVGGYKGFESEEMPSGVSVTVRSDSPQIPGAETTMVFWSNSSPWMANFCIILK
jgi:hypothetical protein